MKRRIYQFLGAFFIGLGFIGAFLPILPTTPFLLLSLFFLTRSSPRLAEWLLNHPRFGGPLRDWREGGVIRTRPKIMSLILILATFSYSIYKAPLLAVKVFLILLGIGLLFFILSRPSVQRFHR